MPSAINIEVLFYLFVGLAGLMVILLLWLVNIHRRFKRFMRGKRGDDLESVLATIIARLERAAERERLVREALDNLDQRVTRKVDHVKTIRFNPFAEQGQGGNHSFATALLDEEGNGVVLSSLYSRDKINVFAKPVISRQSEYELSQEEAEALQPSNNAA